jgi:hypothetical protein
MSTSAVGPATVAAGSTAEHGPSVHRLTRTPDSAPASPRVTDDIHCLIIFPRAQPDRSEEPVLPAFEIPAPFGERLVTGGLELV